MSKNYIQKQIRVQKRVLGKERDLVFIRLRAGKMLEIQHHLLGIVIERLVSVIPKLLPKGKKLSEVASMQSSELMSILENNSLGMETLFSEVLSLVRDLDFETFIRIAEPILTDVHVDGIHVPALEDSEYFCENPEDIYVVTILGVMANFPKTFSMEGLLGKVKSRLDLQETNEKTND